MKIKTLYHCSCAYLYHLEILICIRTSSHGSNPNITMEIWRQRIKYLLKSIYMNVGLLSSKIWEFTAKGELSSRVAVQSPEYCFHRSILCESNLLV